MGTQEKNTGADLGPFWHGHKRFPRVAEWDATNDQYIAFIYHSVSILANQVLELPEKVDEAMIRKKLEAIKVPEWVLSEETIDVDEDADDEKEKEEKVEEKVDLGDDEQKQIDALREQLNALDVSTLAKIKAADFEKDDDQNHHIDIITSATNLRAWNYKLEEQSSQKVRMIAGKIIPAIATTTACITGFIGLEVMKHVRNAPLEARRMATINLAVNVYSIENLPDPKKVKSGMDPATYMELKAIPEGYTTWDFVEMKNPGVTVGEFLDEFKKIHHDVTITLLGNDDKVFYDDGSKKAEERNNHLLMLSQTFWEVPSSQRIVIILFLILLVWKPPMKKTVKSPKLNGISNKFY